MIDQTGITYRVWHSTVYRYERTMTDGYTVAYLTPRQTPFQDVIESSIQLTPAPDEVDGGRDVFGNVLTQYGVHHGHDQLAVEATSLVHVVPPVVPSVSSPWEQVRDKAASLRGPEALDVTPFVGSSLFVNVAEHRAVLGELAGVFTLGRPIVDAVAALGHEIFTTFEFDPSFTELSTPLATVLTNRRGVCQDFAHLAIAVLRSLGLPARYVSGYIETDPPDGEPRVFGADASHAWCSVWVGDAASGPSGGWLDVDPTNDHVAPQRHVTVAWGRDYGDVTPVRGVVIGPSTTQTLEVNVDVSRVG